MGHYALHRAGTLQQQSDRAARAIRDRWEFPILLGSVNGQFISLSMQSRT